MSDERNTVYKHPPFRTPRIGESRRVRPNRGSVEDLAERFFRWHVWYSGQNAGKATNSLFNYAGLWCHSNAIEGDGSSPTKPIARFIPIGTAHDQTNPAVLISTPGDYPARKHAKVLHRAAKEWGVDPVEIDGSKLRALFLNEILRGLTTHGQSARAALNASRAPEDPIPSPYPEG